VSDSVSKTLRIRNETEFLSSVRDAVREVVTLGRFPEGELNRLTLAVDESVTNIMEHAYEHDLEGNEQIEIVIEGSPEVFVACIRDWGTTFNPLDVPAPNLKDHVKEGRKHGLGIFLIRQIMDEVAYATADDGMNELRMVKYAKRPDKGAEAVAAKEGSAS
jgi:serine/threonine-protein kinase RsbW